MSKSLVYLATPYSHQSKDVMEERFKAVNKITAQLMREGVHVYSPISHTHFISKEHDLPTTWKFWEGYCRCILSSCCRLIVFKQEGWESSIGVAAEIKIAQELDLPVEFI